MKVLINKHYGGFSLSHEIHEKLGIPGYICNISLGYAEDAPFHAYRTDERLIKEVEELGLEDSSGSYASIKIVEIPDDIEWEIHEYAGIEIIHEVHRSWN